MAPENAADGTQSKSGVVRARSRRGACVAGVLAGCWALAASPAAIAAGELDSSFGDGGIVRSPLQAEVPQGDPIAFDGGKTVVVGHAFTSSFNETNIVVVRLNEDGSPDSSFDGDGVAVIPSFRSATETEAASDDTADSVAIDALGRIVIAGGADELLAVARLNPDGSPDTSFSEDGKTTVDLNQAHIADARKAIALDGSRIVIASDATLTDSSGLSFRVAVTRLNDDGSPDNSFAGTGSMILDSGAGEFTVDLALDGSKPVVLTRSSTPEGDPVHRLVRVSPDGSLDASFGGDGVVEERQTYGQAVALQGSSPVVVGSTVADHRDIALLRYTPNGGLDAGFGNGGRVTTRVGQVVPDQPCLGEGGDFFNSRAEDVAIDGAGRILLAGSADIGHFLLARYGAGGAIEGLVAREVGATGGEVEYSPSPDGMAVGSPGIELVGMDGPDRPVIARFRSDGPFIEAPQCGGASASAPQTKIRKGPKKRTTKRKATFRFGADEPSTFECKLDRKKWRPCKSPKKVKVDPGKHTFRCRATDGDGNTDRTPAVFKWKVLAQ